VRKGSFFIIGFLSLGEPEAKTADSPRRHIGRCDPPSLEEESDEVFHDFGAEEVMVCRDVAMSL
jgi:hypothetical protein